MKNKPGKLITENIPGFVELEILYNSYPHLLLKGKRIKDGKSIVLKTLQDKYPKKEHIAGITREYQLLSKAQVEGVVEVFDFFGYGNGNVAIEMENFGLSLEDYRHSQSPKKIPLPLLLSISLKLVKTLGRIHDKGIIHKDLVPRNILVNPENFEVKIIDFSSSTELSREHQEVTFPNSISGSLPYISPEQTGRMNRDIDYRTDYYTVGVSLFELGTGQLPFQASDALEWVHCHISKPPKVAKEIDPEFPSALSDLLGKLMAKNAEDRYQSTKGISHDLEQINSAFEAGAKDFPLELAKGDILGKFQIPQKLYGREIEIQKLETYLQKATNGSAEFCLVSGYSGVGKSALVHEFGRTVARKKGFLIQGKFEQFRQNTAYSALAGAFKELIHHLLGESKARLDIWSKQINDALDHQGQLILDLIPELELIIGKQPKVQELSPSENQNRFSLTFLNFVKVFAQKNHPLVIFLDDLQWSDIPTLNLINRLLGSQELGYILLIGAFRDNAVDEAHPLMLTLEEIKKKRWVENITLPPLGQSVIDQIVQDTLHCGVELANDLGKVLIEKTGGNPFYSIEFLKDLHSQKIISFDSLSGKWTWDPEKLQGISQSENVVDFLVKNLSKLPENTQIALQLAACIGATFDLKTLAMISKTSMEKAAADLYDALMANLIFPLHESYRLVGLSFDHATQKLYVGKDQEEHQINPTYKFQHDRVQQAAYSTIPNERKELMHLSIGRLLLLHSDQIHLQEILIDVVEHLNKGKNWITDYEEKFQLAELNLKAGIKAKQSSAYDSALQYLLISLDLLDAKTWETNYPLMWKLGEELQNCFYLTGNQKEAEEWSEVILIQAKTDIEKGLVLAARTRQYATTGRMKESIEAAYQGLGILGFDFISNPSNEDLDREIYLLEQKLGERRVADLIHLPEMTDERARIASQLLMETFAAAFLSGTGRKFPYLVIKSVNLALTYGNCPETAFSYAGYGMILCGYFENTALGYQYGKLGVEMIEAYGDIALKSRILYVYTMFVHHWSNHWSSMTPWFRKGIDTGYQSGDLLYLAYSAQDCIIWDPKLDLDTAIQEQIRLLKIVAECNYQDSLDSGTLFLQMQKNFQGKTEGKYSLTSKYFDEEACLKGMNERHFLTGIANYHIYKAEIHLLYNDPKGALPHVLAQENLMPSVMSLPQLVRFHIVAFLVRSMLLHEITQENKRKEYVKKMEYNYSKMFHWAEQCEENFEHLRWFMEAEMAGHLGKVSEALQGFEKALSFAQKHGFLRDEAMINEFAANFYIRNGLEKASEGYLKASHYLYYRWGAIRKTEEMVANYPQILTSGTLSKSPSQTQSIRLNSSITEEFGNNLLDMSSVFRASQMISGELILEKLLKATLQVLLENAGAQHGYLIEKRDGNFYIQASSLENENMKESFLDSENIDFLPISLINTAIRTNEPIVIANASQSNPFSNDPYILKSKPLSVLCIPLTTNRQWKVVIYLENNLTHSAFTEERVQIIKLLAAQAAISIENSRIYENQEKLLKAQQRFVPDQFLAHLGHEDISKVSLGESVAMEMSVLFSDIRDFTPLVEKLSPEKVINILNQYFSKIGSHITRAGGFIDSYAGDEILALFAVPSQKALEAGINMAKALYEFNQESVSLGRPILKMGIGVNTGPLVLGTMGGDDRMQCTVLGDTVNLGSRIENLTKVYGAQFLISEHTYYSLENPQAFSFRKVDRVAVKGKAKAVDLYEVLDAEFEERRTKKEATKEVLADGLKAYYARDFEKALNLFDSGYKLDPDDQTFKIFIERCQKYQEHPPGQEWQGYEIMQHK
ncbi:putative ATPase [Algoriphagus boseongensis]|uniref:Putative ATPase n=1 Tax=Algoriphagus boseongensis TaxID=1442587 RepID=A0A4R6T9N3_9BACT|nr:AAA family ATPase [Algoriphagus boseongensis]TDQ19481.1 putative ATPase [Algoriphagus boseongensis]